MTEVLELTPARPTLRADQRGYILGDESIDGFADRPDLADDQRTIIARFARRYAPDTLSPEQKRLLEKFDKSGPPSASPLLHALAAEEAQLEEAYLLGFGEELTKRQRDLLANPGRHPALKGRTYPLSIGEVEKLTEATARQLRYWEEGGLLKAQRLNGQRKYFRSAVLRAMVLANTPPNHVNAVRAVAAGADEGERLIRLLGAQLASTAPQEEIGRAGRELIQIGRALVEYSVGVREVGKKIAERAAAPAKTAVGADWAVARDARSGVYTVVASRSGGVTATSPAAKTAASAKKSRAGKSGAKKAGSAKSSARRSSKHS